MTWYEKIIAAHRQVTDAVSHVVRMKSDRYFVWQEDGENNLPADGRIAEQAITGTTDLFTKQEFDPWRKQFEEAMTASPYIAWGFESVQFEEETGFWHYEWRWTVT